MTSLAAALRRFRRRLHRTPPAETSTRWHSVSSTHEYETCPRRYRFAYVDHTPADRGLAPEAWRFGTVVHRGLEAGYRWHQEHGDSADMTRAIPVALEAVRVAWMTERMPEDPAERLRADQVVHRSLATTRLDPAEILGIEIFLHAETPEGFQVTGALDLVLHTGPERLEIRDHKVTRALLRPEELAGDFQLNVYGWLARATWPWAEHVTIAHHYPLGGEIVRAELDDAQVELALTRLRDIAARAEADATFAPKPGQHCTSCAWAPLCPSTSFTPSANPIACQ
jgi:CRISPR/Cas system-associated exonuclease Cas4 (RecB family)